MMNLANRVGKFCVLVLCACIFGACSQKKVTILTPKDLSTLPQNANYYLPQDTLEFPKLDSKALQKDYLQKFFSPWLQKGPNPNVDEVFWIRPSLLKSHGWGENLKPYTLADGQKVLDSMQLDLYPSANQKAIITKNTHVRAVPSMLPKFSKRDGYPFDRWQNSLIFSGTPVLITHYDSSRRFAHIESAFVYGWVEAQDVATLRDADVKQIMSWGSYITPNRDKIALLDSKKHFVTQARIGQIFALKAKVGDFYEIYNIVRQDDGRAKIHTLKVKKQDFIPFPSELDQALVADFLTQLMGRPYGWGGMYEERDCSALVRDIFAHNGIFLPRNSKTQVFYGKNSVDLSKMSPTDKEAYIIANATPFYTILWLQGHIMIYLGHSQGRVIVAHSAWSVTSGKRYENMLGGVVITTLHVGEEYNGMFRHSKTLLERIGAMSDMTILSQNIAQGRIQK
ncbi:NlpC/P60 family N-terminal domain-containing protein [uncultured Helicobacter sp.]|uniref:NlpC/P60 family N-terminal domain-containing protein n=1 Tax=uncultured Helicobacter sp. TaxID=175537 RepID=UPI00374F8F6F